MRNHAFLTGLGIVTIAMLTGCGSSSKDAGAQAPAAGGSSATSSDAGSDGGAGKKVDICTVLPAATAAQLAGQPYTKAVPQTGNWASTCAYNNDDSTAEGVNINLDNQTAATTWSQVHTGSVTDISGLGDKAFWDNDNTLYVLAGNDLIQVNGLDSQDKSEALAKPVLDALH